MWLNLHSRTNSLKNFRHQLPALSVWTVTGISCVANDRFSASATHVAVVSCNCSRAKNVKTINPQRQRNYLHQKWINPLPLLSMAFSMFREESVLPFFAGWNSLHMAEMWSWTAGNVVVNHFRHTRPEQHTASFPQTWISTKRDYSVSYQALYGAPPLVSKFSDLFVMIHWSSTSSSRNAQ